MLSKVTKAFVNLPEVLLLLLLLLLLLFAQTIATITIKLTLHYGVRIYALQSSHYIQPTYSMLLTDKRTLTNSLGLH